MFEMSFLSSILVAVPAAACPTPPPVLVAVLMDDSAVATRTDFSLAQLAAMRQQTGGAGGGSPAVDRLQPEGRPRPGLGCRPPDPP